MKLVMYKIDTFEVKELIENVNSFAFNSNLDKYDWFDEKRVDHSLQGIDHSKFNLILLEDTVEIGSVISSEIVSLDKKYDFKKLTLEEENVELKERLVFAENAILTLMDRM